MNSFGMLLRSYRHRCKSPDSPERPLSQERLGELLGREIGSGFSGAAISDWERGVSKIHADQRLVLINLIRILYEHGGISTPSDADKLLAAGNYRALDHTELQEISFEEPYEFPPAETTIGLKGSQGFRLFLLKGLFLIPNDEIRTLMAEAQEGPAPFWPRVVAAILRRLSDQWSAMHLIRPLLWVWVWLLSWALIWPSLHWPLVNQEEAAVAIKIYVAGTLVIPLLIGVLVDTTHDKYWVENGLASAAVTRLYTYLGAGIGFHLGYFAVFAVNLLGYYLQLPSGIWLELLATAIILLSGYVSARLVPYNLWRAYGRLNLSDGAVFFVYLLLGPLWGFFLFEYNPFLFTSIIGGLSILLIITLLILITAWKQYRNASS